MTEPQTPPTTVSNIGVAMFSVSDQDKAIAFYTEKLGYEVRSDTRFGENGEMRWVEVAPPGSQARLALNPPMGGEPGGGAIGIETPDVNAEYQRLKALLETGQLGRPLMLHNRHRNVASPPGWTSEMLINDSVVHEMDVTRWLLDQEITSVTVLRPTPSANAPDAVQDPQFVVFETDGGAVVDVEIFVNCGFGYQVQAEMVCERGTARVGDGHALVTNMAGRWGGTIAQDFVERFADAYDREVQAWVDATRRGEVTGPGVWDGYAVAAVCEAGVRSLEDGGRVPVELVERPPLYRVSRASG
jgi:myo-inositol 2-dehydrogenase/D-chiro-inositol 1-dehydrogenase